MQLYLLLHFPTLSHTALTPLLRRTIGEARVAPQALRRTLHTHTPRPSASPASASARPLAYQPYHPHDCHARIHGAAHIMHAVRRLLSFSRPPSSRGALRCDGRRARYASRRPVCASCAPRPRRYCRQWLEPGFPSHRHHSSTRRRYQGTWLCRATCQTCSHCCTDRLILQRSSKRLASGLVATQMSKQSR